MFETFVERVRENIKTQSPILDLGNCGLPEIPDVVCELDWLEVLSFSDEITTWDNEYKKAITRKTTNKDKSNFITTINPNLVNLKKLKRLYLGSSFGDKTRITDISILGELESLIVLDCSRIDIADISPLNNLKRLQFLNLSGCSNINTNHLKTLSSLRYLGLSLCQLSQLSFLSNLSELEYLGIAKNPIKNFSEIAYLSNLIEIEAFDCGISNIDFLSNLKKLQVIHFEENKIQDIAVLENLNELIEIHFIENDIKNIDSIGNLKKLREIAFLGNKISDISIIGQINTLKSIDFCYNPIQDYSPINELKNIKNLMLHGTEIENIDFFTNKNKIEELELSYCKISQLNNLDLFENLIKLELEGNNILDLNFLKKLVKIENLDLGINNITDISPITNLHTLKELFLRQNSIIDLSPLLNLTKLETIDITDNDISDLKTIRKVAFLPNLKSLYLQGNPVNIPEEIIDYRTTWDLQALRTYFLDSDKGVSNEKSVKLIFLGDGCAGKSTLYHHLKNEQKPPIIDIENRTHGIALDKWESELNDIEIKVWDFGGQDIFHSTHRLFLGQRAVYVLVWTKQENKKCTEGEQHPLRYWLDFIADYGAKSTVFLVENVIDGNFDSSELPDDASMQELIDEYKSKEITLVTTPFRFDCLNDTEAVLDFKAILQNRIKTLTKKYGYESFPDNWSKVQQRVELLKTDNKTIYIEDFELLCKEQNIENAEVLLKYLHNSGVFSYYEDIFKDKIILQIDWVLEAIYAFLHLKNNPLAKLGGKLNIRDFSLVWSEKYNLHEQSLFRQFMFRSHLIATPDYKIKRDYEYLIPALFPINKPHEKINWEHLDSYIVIKFRFIYKAIIQRLQVKILNVCHIEEEESFYQNRISFTDPNGNFAHIELIEECKEIRVFTENKDLNSKILFEINEIYPLSRTQLFKRNVNKVEKKISFDINMFKSNQIEIKGFEENNMKNEKRIRVFVTYCWTDKFGNLDEIHQENVRKFVDGLIEYDKSFDATFDKYENETVTANNFIEMMYKNIYRSDKVVIVLSEGYAVKANEKDNGGVPFEYSKIMNDMQSEKTKYIFVTFENRNLENYPFGFKGIDTILIPNGELEVDTYAKNNLFSKLLDEPIYQKPQGGGKTAMIFKK